MFYTHKQQLSEVPLDALFQAVTSAGKNVKDSLEKDAKDAHDRRVARLIEATYAGREESYEGNEEEDYPFSGPDPAFIRKEVQNAKKEALKLWSEKYALETLAPWFLPQLTAHIAKMSTCGGNSVEYLNQFAIDDFHKGIWVLATHPVRGDFVPKQYTAAMRSYCALVPLLLMPHKKFNSMDYSKWSKEGLVNLMDSNLYEAITCPFTHNMSKEEILRIRHIGMEYKSGKNEGTFRNPQTSHKIYGVSGELKKLPWLVQVMLFQIWCAHPVNRSDLMILDWKDLDFMPDPLIEAVTVKAPSIVEKKKVSYGDEFPWE